MELSDLKYKYEKQSKESKFVLGLTILLIVYFSNTADKQIVNFTSNFWFSIILSIIIIIFWFIFTN